MTPTMLDVATEVFGDETTARRWLETPKRRFGGRAPIELPRSDEGGRRVEEALQQARHGFTA